MEGVQVNNYISGTNRVISETPISDSTAHNIADLGMLCRRLERKLAATRHYLSVVSERVKRLEEAGDALYEGWIGYGFTKDKHLAAWIKAKEAKP
jgi:hypothetical protein